ncbi:MAG: hypothetical protein RLZZ385_2435 [Pseudomonadota bacterium]|jgi:hypothetical protein
MPLIYEAKMDGSNAVRYFHLSLVRFYLDLAYEYSLKSKKEHKDGVLLASSIIGILFSSMSLEAFVNEVSESVIPKNELNDFIRLRKKYKKGKGESSVTTNLKILFKLKFGENVDPEAIEGIETTMDLRNNLAHYKLSELAGKYILPPVKKIESANGQIMHAIDFTVQPEKVEPPFVQKVTSTAAINCFNSSLGIIKKWGALQGEEDNVPGLEIIT